MRVTDDFVAITGIRGSSCEVTETTSTKSTRYAVVMVTALIKIVSGKVHLH